ERRQGGRIVAVEGRGGRPVEMEGCLLEALRIAPGKDDAGALGAGSPGGLQPDAAAAADHNDGLAEQYRIALGGYSSRCGGHSSSVGWGGRGGTSRRSAVLSVIFVEVGQEPTKERVAQLGPSTSPF